MKAQSKIEFIVTTFIYCLFLVYVIMFFIDSMVSVVYSTRASSAKITAETIADILAREEGIPPDWYIHPSSIKRIGLSSGAPFNLSLEKINYLNTHCELINNVFNLNNYRIRIVTSNGVTLLNCGGVGSAKAQVEYPVFVNGKKAKLIVEIWW